MKFNVGDRVKKIDGSFEGYKGKIIYDDGSDCLRYLVEFDKYDSGLHDGDGKGKNGHCYWCSGSELKKIEFKFKVGDIIRGKQGNGYGITNENMTKAEVIDVYNSCGHDKMKIRVLEHKSDCQIGDTWSVENTDKKFDLYETTELDKLQRKLKKHEAKVIELKEKIKKLTEIKVGDKVKVINDGKLYTSYVSWVEREITDTYEKYSYDYDNNIDDGAECEVLHIAKHGKGFDSDRTLAYIREFKTNRCYLIGIEGLEKC